VPLTDLPLEELRAYRPEVPEPADLDAFWSMALAREAAEDLALRREPVDTGLRLVECHDVTFSGACGHPVRAWLLLPVGIDGPLPAVVEYNGYGGGRGMPHERLGWVAAGYAYMIMDTRGQGSAWGSGGHTPDPVGSGPCVPGFMTRGICDPDQYYYRRVYVDAVRAVQAVRAVDRVDPARVAVSGGSQGGGICLAVAALVDDLAAVMVDVPFLCHFRRAVEMAVRDPYAEIVRYLAVHRHRVEQVFATLSYFDGVLFAARASAPALFSVALMDDVCPPSTVFAAYNAYAGPKEIEVYPFNGHEGGQEHQFARCLAWLGRLLDGGTGS